MEAACKCPGCSFSRQNNRGTAWGLREHNQSSHPRHGRGAGGCGAEAGLCRGGEHCAGLGEQPSHWLPCSLLRERKDPFPVRSFMGPQHHAREPRGLSAPKGGRDILVPSFGNTGPGSPLRKAVWWKSTLPVCELSIKKRLSSPSPRPPQRASPREFVHRGPRAQGQGTGRRMK